MNSKYKNRSFTVNDILVYLSNENTQWAIPKLQRPFVWNGNKVTNFISSMYMGYPVGSIMTWKAQGVSKNRTKSIHGGPIEKGDLTDLVLDGQQRLTSLKILFEGLQVEGPAGKMRSIKIQFNPLAELSGDPQKAFKEYKSNKVTPRWIDVTSVLKDNKPVAACNEYFAANPGLTDVEKNAAEKAIVDLLRLREYQIACVEVSENVDVENAAEIFFRINSTGTALKSSDFILTLLEVNDSALRDRISNFSREAAALPVVKDVFLPENGDILAALVGYSFRQSAGKKVYEILRGRDGGKFDPELKKSNFETLNSNVEIVCDLKSWKDFIHALIGAGVCHRNLVTSEAALIASYVIYLMMTHKSGSVSKELRQKAIGRWLLFCNFTSRYTSHTDSQTANDCKLFDEAKTSADVVGLINKTIDATLTDTFWQSTSAEGRDTIVTCALIQQGRKTLFSKVHKISDQYLQSGSGMEVQIHHIFPQNYMLTHPEDSKRRDLDASNVGPNKASIDAETNRFISDKAPKDYAVELKKRNGFSDEEWAEMCAANAMPENWHTMEFDDFVAARAKLMPGVIRKTFDALR